MPYTRGQDSLIMSVLFLLCLHYILWPSSSAQVTEANLCHGSVIISGRLTYHLCEDGSWCSQQENNGPYTGKKKLDPGGTVRRYTQDFVLTSAMVSHGQLGPNWSLNSTPLCSFSFFISLFFEWEDVCHKRGLRNPYYFICALHLTRASLCPLLVLGFREERQPTFCVWATLYGTDKHLQKSRMASHTLENMTASECQHFPNVTTTYSDSWDERRWKEEKGCVRCHVLQTH